VSAGHGRTPAGHESEVNGDPAPTSAVPGIDAHRLDKARVRRLAARAAAHYDAAAWLPRRVADALVEHLQPVRIRPARILDVGAGTGICTRRLARLYPSARIIAVDCAMPMLRQARGRRPRGFAGRALACGDAEALPLADASVDLLVSSLMLPSCPSPEAALAEFQRVLEPGGLLMFSSLGPDTLRELRASWTAVDAHVHVHAFFDMHDLGDALMRAGLRDVVMDTERITAEYRDVRTLFGELKQLGASNAARGCRAGLTTPARLAAMTAAYERQRRGARLPASFEIVFGHAWRAPSRSVDVSDDALSRVAQASSRG
jgi:malonyl-CoA O-methyltransferase